MMLFLVIYSIDFWVLYQSKINLDQFDFQLIYILNLNFLLDTRTSHLNTFELKWYLWALDCGKHRFFYYISLQY